VYVETEEERRRGECRKRGNSRPRERERERGGEKVADKFKKVWGRETQGKYDDRPWDGNDQRHLQDQLIIIMIIVLLPLFSSGASLLFFTWRVRVLATDTGELPRSQASEEGKKVESDVRGAKAEQERNANPVRVCQGRRASSYPNGWAMEMMGSVVGVETRSL
jgi:hypothetical protein